MTCKHVPDFQSHKRTVSSVNPVDAIQSPLGDRATECTELLCPSKFPRQVPVSRSQILTVLSPEPVKPCRPSGVTATDHTVLVFSFMFTMRCPASRSHNATSPSCPPIRRRFPSALRAAAMTVWPTWIVFVHSPESVTHSLIELSPATPPDNNILPFPIGTTGRTMY